MMVGSQAGTETDSGDLQRKCRITEIVQYTCPVEQDEHGHLQYICYPIPRIFRICQDRPAVEITKRVHIDMNTGQVDLSQELNHTLLKGKPWRDIIQLKRDSKDN